MADFTFAHEVGDRRGDLFDRYGGVDPVLVIEVDHVGAQAAQRPFDRAAYLLRTAVESLLAVLHLNPEFRGHDHLAAYRGEGLADQLLVGVRPVDLGRVEEGDALLVGAADQRDHLPFVGGGSVAVAHAHAAQADGRNFRTAFSQFSVFHNFGF